MKCENDISTCIKAKFACDIIITGVVKKYFLTGKKKNIIKIKIKIKTGFVYPTTRKVTRYSSSLFQLLYGNRIILLPLVVTDDTSYKQVT